MQVWGACPVHTWGGKAVFKRLRPMFRAAVLLLGPCVGVWLCWTPVPCRVTGSLHGCWVFPFSVPQQVHLSGEGTWGQTSLEAETLSAPGVGPSTVASLAWSLSVGPGCCVFLIPRSSH